MRLVGKEIILGVCGSIAAYKAILLLRLLQQEGAQIRVTMTAAAQEFINPLTFETLAQRPVFHQLWESQDTWSAHVQYARAADLFVIAPATAHTLHKLAQGACDNALAAIYLSANCPVVIAPAMDLEMYAAPAVQHNLNLLRQRGHIIVEPEVGYLASGIEGKGRLANPEVILDVVVNTLTPLPTPLAGKKVLITTGPTREALDPVRYLTNHSTGKMGIALAQAAQAMGASVCVVAGPCAVPLPHQPITCVPVVSADEMFQAVASRYEKFDILIMCAAVADYKPVQVASHKIKKTEQEDHLTIVLEKTQDILAYLGKHKKPNQYLVGFALETHDEIAFAQKKLHNKNADLIVLNSINDAGAGFGKDTNKVTLLTPGAPPQSLPLLSKNDTAFEILRFISQVIT